MKRNRNPHRLSNSRPLPEPALNVVVYRNPGPDDGAIESHARVILKSRSACGTGGGLGYVTFVESDFDRLWNGVERGDAFGTVYSVLGHLGPGARQFIDCMSISSSAGSAGQMNNTAMYYCCRSFHGRSCWR